MTSFTMGATSLVVGSVRRIIGGFMLMAWISAIRCLKG